MEFEILVSSMNNNFDLLEKMNIKSKCLIVNQTDNNNVEVKRVSKNLCKIINSKTKGLSKSRNIAINNMSSKICIFADDDLIYLDNVEEIIIREFEKNKEYDLIAFQVTGIERKFKDYKNKEYNVGYLKSMKISSVEIAFRSKSIRDKKIKFNELLGSGSKYFMGEENEFLFRCLDAGLKIKYIPIKIGDLHIGESTWFKGYDEDYFISRGASYAAMSKGFSKLLILQFGIRKYKTYKKEINYIKAIKCMMNGNRAYLKEKFEVYNE